jgi:hypothetical protein
VLLAFPAPEATRPAQVQVRRSAAGDASADCVWFRAFVALAANSSAIFRYPKAAGKTQIEVSPSSAANIRIRDGSIPGVIRIVEKLAGPVGIVNYGAGEASVVNEVTVGAG